MLTVTVNRNSSCLLASYDLLFFFYGSVFFFVFFVFSLIFFFFFLFWQTRRIKRVLSPSTVPYSSLYHLHTFSYIISFVQSQIFQQFPVFSTPQPTVSKAQHGQQPSFCFLCKTFPLQSIERILIKFR